jgi:poly(3-hydroxyalkanoate) synthetase
MSRPTFSDPFLWPWAAAASAAEATAVALRQLVGSFAADNGWTEPAEAVWTTPNSVVLELPSLRLRSFSAPSQGPATLVCAPYALHCANIADFAPGHSIVEVLLGNDLRRVLVTDWRSATPEMCFFSIDTYLADLNVAVDEVDAPVNLIGLCQGAWMALLFAARFPHKVRRLVLVAGPVDIRAAESRLSRLVAELPLQGFEHLVHEGGGRVLGQQVLQLWGPALGASDIDSVLQLAPSAAANGREDLEQRFREWYAATVDLPGAYYLQVIQQLFKENRIAEGRFVALGRQIDLAAVRIPVLLFAGTRDELIAMDQLFAARRLIGTPEQDVQTITEPCDHLALFLGAKSLRRAWSEIARWLRSRD